MSELELELRELRIDWPATPDVASAVETRLAAAPARRRRRSWLARPAWQVAVAATALILAVVMAIPPARAAVLDWLGISSVRITREEPRPRVGQDLGLGTAVTLEQARERAGFGVVVPEEVGEPDAVYFYEHAALGTRVDLVYRPRPGLPASGTTGAGLLVTEFRARATPVIQKSVGDETSVEQTEVNGDIAYFISGPGHGFAYVDPGNDVVEFEPQRLAGDTLIVDRDDGVLLRIEGELTRERAVEIAESAR